MSEPKKLWEQVGENFGQVGRRLKEHYEREAEGEQGSEAKKVEDALKTLADAVGKAFDAVGAAVQDDSFRRDTSQAARTFGEALASTFDQIGDEIRERLSRKPDGGRPDDRSGS